MSATLSISHGRMSGPKDIAALLIGVASKVAALPDDAKVFFACCPGGEKNEPFVLISVKVDGKEMVEICNLDRDGGVV